MDGIATEWSNRRRKRQMTMLASSGDVLWVRLVWGCYGELRRCSGEQGMFWRVYLFVPATPMVRASDDVFIVVLDTCRTAVFTLLFLFTIDGIRGYAVR